MFYNNLSGLSVDGKKKFDSVCAHLNGIMKERGLYHLDGEEDQILIDLWMDTFPYKLDSKGERIPKIIKEKISETRTVCDADGKIVGGENVMSIREKRVWELDFERSMLDSTSVGIYKWRGEQLLINKIKYLFGDRRTRMMGADGKPMNETKVDSWGNVRTHAVFEDSIDPKKASKRNLALNINEGSLSRPDGESMTLADLGVSDPNAESEFGSALFMADLNKHLSESEIALAKRLIEGETINQLYKSDKSLTTSMMKKFREKVAYTLGRSDLLNA